MSEVSNLRIPLVEPAPRGLAVPQMRSPWLFAGWMAVASVLAVVAGLTLGVLAAAEAGIGAERWTSVVQAHGRIQLFGFVATFVVALALEFLPRLSARPAFPAKIRAGLPGLLALGALLTGIGQVFHVEAGALVLPGALLLAAGSVAFAAVTLRVPTQQPLRAAPQPLFFRAAAVWLAATGLVTAWSLARASDGVVPLAESRLLVDVFLRGFVLMAIIAVALRAFPGHIGTVPVPASRQMLTLGALNGSLVAWIMAQRIGSLPELPLLWKAADVVFAGTLLVFTAWLGATRLLWPRPRGQAGYTLMIPVAWSGLVVYAVLLASMAVFAADGRPGLYQEGAVRHVFLLGFMTPLMLAMAHIVLARFGTGRLQWAGALTTGFVLVTVAWPLRVLPVLTVDSPSEPGQLLLIAAGVLVMAGLVLAAATAARTATSVARLHASG